MVPGPYLFNLFPAGFAGILDFSVLTAWFRDNYLVLILRLLVAAFDDSLNVAAEQAGLSL